MAAAAAVVIAVAAVVVAVVAAVRLARTDRLPPALARRLDRAEATGLVLTVAVAVLVVAGAAFGAVLEMVRSERGLYRFDAGAARWGADHAEPVKGLLEALTQLGSTLVVAAVAAVVAAVAWARRRDGRVALFLLVVVAGQNLLANSIKVLVGRDRPAVLQLVHATGLSFPSGHATAAAATFTAVAVVLGRGRGRVARAMLGVAVAVVVVVVAATRVLLGVHWLTDVVAGSFLGLAWTTACVVAFGPRLTRAPTPRPPP